MFPGLVFLCLMMVTAVPVTAIQPTTSYEGRSSLDYYTMDTMPSPDGEIVVNPGESKKPQHWAVILGISDYKAISDLQFCDEDANDWCNYLTQMGYENILVLGDDSNSYLQYDGLATEYNVKQALTEVVANAGEHDTLAFITSGHGSGNSRGLSLLCMWDITVGENGEDGYFFDYELADILEHAVAKDIFVFIDHCFAGGFGDDLMAMPNADSVYFAATCTERGLGWDAGEYENGMWTYFFLEYALIEVFASDSGTAMEDAFIVAEAVYPFQMGAHNPEAYDGDLIHDFLLW